MLDIYRVIKKSQIYYNIKYFLSPFLQSQPVRGWGAAGTVVIRLMIGLQFKNKILSGLVFYVFNF